MKKNVMRAINPTNADKTPMPATVSIIKYLVVKCKYIAILHIFGGNEFISKGKNMKKFILLFTCCLIATIGLTQDNALDFFPHKDGKINYSEVVNVDSVKKEELYNRAKHWLVETFKSAKDVIQIDDKENGEIVGKGYFKSWWDMGWIGGKNVSVWETLKIQVKDYRYKYEITDFIGKYSTNNINENKEDPLEIWNATRKDVRNELISIDKYMQGMILSLKDYMNKPKDNNW